MLRLDDRDVGLVEAEDWEIAESFAREEDGNEAIEDLSRSCSKTLAIAEQ